MFRFWGQIPKLLVFSIFDKKQLKIYVWSSVVFVWGGLCCLVQEEIGSAGLLLLCLVGDLLGALFLMGKSHLADSDMHATLLVPD